MYIFTCSPPEQKRNKNQKNILYKLENILHFGYVDSFLIWSVVLLNLKKTYDRNATIRPTL